MIRLVTQFDNAETRASAATPTCGGCCCCCCCCIASVVGSSAYTAMNLRAHARVLQDRTGASPSPWPEILGALALVLAVAVGAATGATGLGLAGIVMGAGAWFLLLFGLFSWVGAERPWRPSVGIVVLSAVAFVGEFLLGATLILSGDGGAVVYLVGAIVVGIGAVVIAYQVLLGDK
jgi:hypothetical protein